MARLNWCLAAVISWGKFLFSCFFPLRAARRDKVRLHLFDLLCTDLFQYIHTNWGHLSQLIVNGTRQQSGHSDMPYFFSLSLPVVGLSLSVPVKKVHFVKSCPISMGVQNVVFKKLSYCTLCIVTLI